MGRSQVERNRRLGRPGERGVRTDATNNKPRIPRQHDLGDNSFRYQMDESSINNIDEDDSVWDYVSSANAYGASHVTIHLPSDFDDLHFEKTYHRNMYELDISKLSACIDEMKSSSEWMRLENDRILKIFDDRFQGMNDEKKTLTEINACHPANTNIPHSSNMDDGSKDMDTVTKILVRDCLLKEDQDSSSLRSKNSDSDDENNLQDWLDDMIHE